MAPSISETRMRAKPPSALAPEAAAALAWLHGARFFTTAGNLTHLPDQELPEIASWDEAMPASPARSMR
jgi:GTP-binding protein